MTIEEISDRVKCGQDVAVTRRVLISLLREADDNEITLRWAVRIEGELAVISMPAFERMEFDRNRISPLLMPENLLLSQFHEIRFPWEKRRPTDA